MLLLQLRVDSGVLQPGVSYSFGYKQKAAAIPIHSNISLEENTTTPTTTTTTTTTTMNPTTTTTIAATNSTTTSTTTTPASPTVMPTTSTAAAAENYAVTDFQRKSGFDDGHENDAPRAAEPEPELTVATTSGPVVDDSPSASTIEPLQSGYQESQTDEQQSTSEPRAESQYYTTELPTLIQMHNQQQHEQQEHDQQLHKHNQRDDVQQRGNQEIGRRDQLQQHNNAYAFESLEKAFATAVPHKIRSTKDLEQPKDAVAAAGDLQLPWSWAKDIMLQKPVLKKSSQEVA